MCIEESDPRVCTGAPSSPCGRRLPIMKTATCKSKGGRYRGTASFLGGHACCLPSDEACRLLQPAGALSRSRSSLPLLVGATAGAPAATAGFARSQATKNPESVTLSGLACVGDALAFCGAEEMDRRSRTKELCGAERPSVAKASGLVITDMQRSVPNLCNSEGAICVTGRPRPCLGSELIIRTCVLGP